MTDIHMTGRGLRGESFADVARRIGAIGSVAVSPTATDTQVLSVLAAGVALLGGGTIYASTAAGLAATASGSYFWVADVTGLRLYKDNAGVAEEVTPLFAGSRVTAGATTVGALFARADATSQNLILGGGGTLLTNSASGVHNGDSVTGIGYGCFSVATTAYACWAGGTNALGLVTTGHSNTATGYQALCRATTGDSNTATGVDCAFNITTGTRMVVAGRHAMATTDGSVSFTGSRGVVVGETAARAATNWTDFVTIGCNAMSASPATGSLSFVAIGANIFAKTSAIRTVGIGYDIMQSTSGAGTRAATECVLIGNRLMFGVQQATYCSVVGAFGFYQDDGDTTTSDANTGLGAYVGQYVSGNRNTAVGAYALRRTTKQAIGDTTMVGHRVGDQSGSDWTPVDGDMAIGNGPTMAQTWLRGNVTSGLVITIGPIRCKSYTVGTVPSASTSGAGATIYVSNESGGAVLAFSDATNWRRVTDRAIIS